MAKQNSKSNLPRSIGAIFVGILANFIIALVFDMIFHSLGAFPPMTGRMTDAQCLLAFSYRFVAAIVGGYFTARIAPQKPIQHALVLGGIGMALSTAGAVAGWGLGPDWFPIALIVIAIPCSWVGAKLQIKKSRR